MVSTKKIAGYGGAGIVVLGVGAYLIFNGMFLIGVAVIGAGLLGMLLFREIIAPRFEKEIPERPAAPQIEASKPEEKIEATVKEIEQEESRIATLIGRFVTLARKISSREKTPETTGRVETKRGEIDIVEQARPEIQKSAEAIEKLISKFIRDVKNIEKEIASVGTKVSDIKKKHKELESHSKKVKAKAEEYGEGMKGEEEKKGKRLRKIEIELGAARRDQMHDLVLSEATKAAAICTKLEDLSATILQSMKNALNEIPPDFRNIKEFNDMMARLDRMHTTVNDKLLPKATEHRKLAMDLAKELRQFESMLVGLKQSDLADKLIDERKKAEEAETDALKAQKRIREIEKDTYETKIKNEELRERITVLEHELEYIGRILGKWQVDIKKAREEAKKNPLLKQAEVDVLSRNVTQGNNIITDLTLLLLDREEYSRSTAKERDHLKETLLEVKSRLSSITDKRDSVTTAYHTAEELKKELTELVERLKKKKEDDEHLIKATTEQALRDRYQTEIDSITRQMEEARAQYTEASTEASLLREEIQEVTGELQEANRNLVSLQPRLPVLEQQAKNAEAELARTRQELERLSVEHAKELKQLRERIATLESDNTGLKASSTENERKISDLTRSLTAATEDAHEYLERLKERWEDFGTAEQQVTRFQESEKALRAQVDSLTKQNASLSRWLGKRIAISSARKKKLEVLQQMYEREARTVSELQEKKTRAKEIIVKHCHGLTDEVRFLSARLTEVSSTAMGKVDQELLDDINRQLKERNEELERAYKEMRQIEERTAAEIKQGRSAENRAKLLQHELQAANLERERAVAELEQRIRQLKEESTQWRTEAETLRGRIAEITAADAASQQEIEELFERIHERDEIIGTLRDADRKKALTEERNAEIGQALLNLKEIIGNSKKLRELTTRLYDAEIRSVLEQVALKQSLAEEKDSLQPQLDAARAENERLSREIGEMLSLLGEAKKRLIELEALKTKTPQLEAQIQSLKDQIEDYEIQHAQIDALYIAKSEEVEKTLGIIHRLEADLASISTESTVLGKDLSDEFMQRVHDAWFNKKLEPITDKMSQVQDLIAENPDEAMKLVSDAIILVNQINKSIITKIEGDRIAGIISMATDLKAQLMQEVPVPEPITGEAVIKEKTPEPMPAAVAVPDKLAVLEPFVKDKYYASIWQLQTPTDAGKEVAMVVLDHTKDTIVFGRKTRNKPLKDEKADVLMTGEDPEMSSVSRESFVITRKGDWSYLVAKGSFQMRVPIHEDIVYDIMDMKRRRHLLSMKKGVYYIFLDNAWREIVPHDANDGRWKEFLRQNKELNKEVTKPFIADFDGECKQIDIDFLKEIPPESSNFLIMLSYDMQLKLEDGMRFYINLDGELGYRYIVVSKEKIIKSQNATWHKTAIDFARKNSQGGIPDSIDAEEDRSEVVVTRVNKNQEFGLFALPSNTKVFEEIKGRLMEKQGQSAMILNKQTVRIGADKKNDITLAVSQAYEVNIKGRNYKVNDRFAAIQATVTKEDDGYYIVNNSEHKNTYLNAKPVKGRKKLAIGDVIQFTEAKPIFVMFDSREFQASEQIAWEKYGLIFEFTDKSETPDEFRKRRGIKIKSGIRRLFGA